MIRQAGLMMPRGKDMEPLYRLSQIEFYILMAFKGNLGNKPISRYVALLDLRKQGFFKKVPDNTPINEILRNCEVVG